MAAALDPTRIPASFQKRIETIEEVMHSDLAPAAFTSADLHDEILLLEIDLRLHESDSWDKVMAAIKGHRRIASFGQALSIVEQFVEILDLPRNETIDLLQELLTLRQECAEEEEKQQAKKGLLEKISEEYPVHLRILSAMPCAEEGIAAIQALIPFLEAQINEAVQTKERLTTEINEINTKLSKGIGNKTRLKDSLKTKKAEKTSADTTIQNLKEEKRELESKLFTMIREHQLSQGKASIFLKTFLQRSKKLSDEIALLQVGIDEKNKRMDVIQRQIQDHVIWGKLDPHISELRERCTALKHERDKRLFGVLS